MSVSPARGRRGGSSRSRPGVTRSPWSAGAPMASTTASRRKGASRCSRTTASGSARSLSTMPRRKGSRFASSASTRPRSARSESSARSPEISPRSEGAPGLSAGDSLLEAASIRRVSRKSLIGHELFESIYNKGKLLILASWRNAAAASAWKPRAFRQGAGAVRHRRVRVIRDYGMFERREAPQYYPEVEAEKRAGPRDIGAKISVIPWSPGVIGLVSSPAKESMIKLAFDHGWDSFPSKDFVHGTAGNDSCVHPFPR